MRGELPEFSDETLLGYLLGGLSDEEIALVEASLGISEILRQRLADLQGMLEPFAATAEADCLHELPPDLVANTLSGIEAQEGCVRATGDPSLGRIELSDSMSCDWSEASASTRIAWMDSLVTIAAGIIFFSFLLPSVWQWREAARQLACAENLRNVGFGLLSYVNLSPSREIPAIEVSGPKAFAGMYAIHLRDRDLLDSPRWVICPSNPSLTIPSQIPTTDQFLSVSPEQQQILSYLVGGNYAYHLGSWIDGEYRTPRLDAPVRFAVLGDRWPSISGVVQDTHQPPVLHGDRAANMFYNDGSVRLIRIPSQAETESASAVGVDNPFLNRAMEQGVGLGIQDACLGPSYWRPSIDIDRPR
jgi:prepilin-type processing-associated H-X9-DG protein